MFTHVYFGTNDIEKSKKFYDAAMGALGYAAAPYPNGAIYPSASGAVIIAPPADGKPATFGNGHTLGFAAKSYAEVDAFHADGVAAGGTCEGAPGFRPQSPGNMYGAYLRDPDGNKICAYAPNVGEKD
ncbi:MAG: glyoxalase [Sphingomonadales bacterium 32-67-7]|nr:MAG: glyoxalase [Sphingomonadales bacterium 32-67-7]